MLEPLVGDEGSHTFPRLPTPSQHLMDRASWYVEGCENLRRFITPGNLATLTNSKTVHDEVIFLSRLSKRNPTEAGALLLLHATYPLQVCGVSPWLLAAIILHPPHLLCCNYCVWIADTRLL